MIDETSEIQLASRGTLARIGITLLNIIQPGLGLLRLGKVRSALIFLSAQLLGLSLVWLAYNVTKTMTFAVWVSIISIVLLIVLVAYLGSMVSTWRLSRRVEQRTGWLWRWYGIILVWLGIIVLTAPLGDFPRGHYRNFWVPAASMDPSLQVGDRFIAKMQSFEPLRRGDVVIVRKGLTEYVKRIVAIPGDTIAMANGRIILNGQEIKQREVTKAQVDIGGNLQLATLLEEQLPGEDQSHQVVDAGVTPQDDWKGVVLGPDQFVLLGDSRDNSLDSRMPEEVEGLGIVTRSRIEGRAIFRYWRRGIGLGEGKI